MITQETSGAISDNEAKPAPKKSSNSTIDGIALSKKTTPPQKAAGSKEKLDVGVQKNKALKEKEGETSIKKTSNRRLWVLLVVLIVLLVIGVGIMYCLSNSEKIGEWFGY